MLPQCRTEIQWTPFTNHQSLLCSPPIITFIIFTYMIFQTINAMLHHGTECQWRPCFTIVQLTRPCYQFLKHITQYIVKHSKLSCNSFGNKYYVRQRVALYHSLKLVLYMFILNYTSWKILYIKCFQTKQISEHVVIKSSHLVFSDTWIMVCITVC